MRCRDRRQICRSVQIHALLAPWQILCGGQAVWHRHSYLGKILSLRRRRAVTRVHVRFSVSLVTSQRTMKDEESSIEKATVYTASPMSSIAPLPELESSEDPRNWSLSHKIYANVIYNMITLLATYTSGVYSPGIKPMRKDFPVSMPVAQLGTSLYMFGLAIGALLWGPLSQTLGRRPVFLMSLIGMTLFNLGVCLSPSMASLLVCRTFAGAMSSAVFVNVAGSIVDMTIEHDRIPYNSMFRFVTFLGPPLAAILGTVAVRDASWRWNLRSIPIYAFVCLVIYAFTMPETYVPILIQHKIEREKEEMEERIEHHNWAYRMAHRIQHRLPSKSLLLLLWKRTIESLPLPWILLFEEPLVIIVCFYTSLLYGLLYGSLLFFPKVWGEVRGYSSVQVAYTYFAVIIGFVLSTIIVGFTIQNVRYKRAYDAGEHTPELRIRLGYFALFFVPIGLFIFGWTAPFIHVHWIAPCIGVVCFAFGMLAVFNSWMAYLTDTYSNNTAAVIAINTFCRSALAGAFPLFITPMMSAMTFQGAMSLFGGVSIPLTAIGIVFAFHGKRIREKSKHAVYG